MPVPKPDSGTTIDKADITGMHDELRSVVNGQQRSTLARKALGPDHIPGAIVGSDVVESTTSETLDDAIVGERITAETTAGITAAKTFTSYTLNNGGLGYTLPPCKVLVFFSLRCQNFDVTHQDFMAGLFVVPTINGVAAPDLEYGGFFPPGNRMDADLVEEHPSCWFMLDQTQAGGNWTLNSLVLKAGIVRANPSGWGATADFPSGVLGFFALYKDQ